MADYVTTTFFKSLNAHRTYNTTSRPTLSQVGSIIPTVTAEIDARFAGVGITVPITTSPTHKAFLYVKRLAALKLAAIAEDSAFMGGNKNDSPHAKWYYDQFEKAMQQIESNPSIMDALLSGTAAVFDSYEYANSDKARDADTDEPFDTTKDVW